MTQKDYELIAVCLNRSYGKNEAWSAVKMFDLIVESLCEGLSRNNPKFDRDKFIEAVYE